MVEKKQISKKSEHDDMEVKGNIAFFIQVVGLVLLTFLIIFYIVYDSEKSVDEVTEPLTLENYDYNGFNCTSAGNFTKCNLFILETGGIYEFEFRARPTDLEYIPIDGDVKKLVSTGIEQIYLTFPGNVEKPEDNSRFAIAASQIGRFFGDFFEYKIPAQAALFKGTVPEEYLETVNVPVVDCSDAKDNVAVLIFNMANETKITQDGSCYTINGVTSDDVILAAERFTYSMLGIMEQ